MKDPAFAKSVVSINALAPLAVIALDWWNGRLGANPLEFFTNTTGLLTLIFLALSLAVTPVRKLTGWNFLSHFRKMLGLFAFFYAFLHLTAYVWFDHFFDLRAVAATSCGGRSSPSACWGSSSWCRWRPRRRTPPSSGSGPSVGSCCTAWRTCRRWPGWCTTA
jgi:hypothetical protein